MSRSSADDRIPVYVDDHVVEWCERGGAREALLIAAANVKVIRHFTKGIVRFIVESVPVDEEQRGGDSSLRFTYEEALGGHNLTVLKRHTAAGYVRWSERDQFNPRRFNPDGPEFAGPSRGVKRRG